MEVPIANFCESKFPLATDPYGGNLKSVANEPGLTNALSVNLPHDILIVHRGAKPITEARFAELMDHFEGVVRSDNPLSGSVQIGMSGDARVDIQLGEVLEKNATLLSQAILASFSKGIASGVRSSVTGAIHRSLELLNAPAESFNLIPTQRLPKQKLVRALKATRWNIKDNHFPAYTIATLNQSTYRVVAYIPNRENVEQVFVTFPGKADGEHSRFHNVKVQNLICGIYSATIKDDERQPLLNDYA